MADSKFGQVVRNGGSMVERKTIGQLNPIRSDYTHVRSLRRDSDRLSSVNGFNRRPYIHTLTDTPWPRRSVAGHDNALLPTSRAYSSGSEPGGSVAGE